MKTSEIGDGDEKEVLYVMSPSSPLPLPPEYKGYVLQLYPESTTLDAALHFHPRRYHK
jgi:hypothetical protein